MGTPETEEVDVEVWRACEERNRSGEGGELNLRLKSTADNFWYVVDFLGVANFVREEALESR